MFNASVIIPTFNRGAILADTMAMALTQDYPSFEVIVIDQSSSIPESVQSLVQAAGARLQYVRLKDPNLPRARNTGVRLAKGEIIVFIDDDVIIDRNYVARHVQHYTNPAVGGVMGLTVPAAQVDDDHVQRTLLRFQARTLSEDGTATVLWMNGCNSSYRREGIINAGMSDERYTGSSWAEDADLAVRVRALGYSLLFDPQIRLVHLESTSGGCGNRTPTDSYNLCEERCLLIFLFVLKNFRVIPVRLAFSFLWPTYRACACNRSTVCSLRIFWKHNRMFLRTFVKARRLLRAKALDLNLHYGAEG